MFQTNSIEGIESFSQNNENEEEINSSFKADINLLQESIKDIEISTSLIEPFTNESIIIYDLVELNREFITIRKIKNNQNIIEFKKIINRIRSLIKYNRNFGLIFINKNMEYILDYLSYINELTSNDYIKSTIISNDNYIYRINYILIIINDLFESYKFYKENVYEKWIVLLIPKLFEIYKIVVSQKLINNQKMKILIESILDNMGKYNVGLMHKILINNYLKINNDICYFELSCACLINFFGSNELNEYIIDYDLLMDNIGRVYLNGNNQYESICKKFLKNIKKFVKFYDNNDDFIDSFQNDNNIIKMTDFEEYNNRLKEIEDQQFQSYTNNPSLENEEMYIDMSPNIEVTNENNVDTNSEISIININNATTNNQKNDKTYSKDIKTNFKKFD